MEKFEMTELSITGTPVDGTVADEVTPAVSDVTTPAGTQAEVTTTTETVDVDWKSRFEEVSAKANKDINALKSSLQRQAEQDKRALKAEYDKLLAETRMSTMDDKQKKQYQESLKEQEVVQMRQQLQQYQQIAEEQQALNQTYSWLLTQGIPPDKLDVSQGLNGLSTSGWNYLSEENKALRNELAKYKGTQVAATPGKPTAPQTAQHQTGVPKGKMTLVEFAKAYGDGNLEKAYELMENHPELGITPPEQ
jgi:hypothetical protein